MKFRFNIRHLLLALAIIGLVLAPIAARAVPMPAGDIHAMSEHGAMPGDEVGAMNPDMPCCPKELPASDCAKDCAFMAMCATLSFQVPTSSSALFYPLVSGDPLALHNDAQLSSLAQPPPPRPPRT